MPQRDPLRAVNGKERYRQALSIWQRAQISACKAAGLLNKQIIRRRFCKPTAVQTILPLNAL
jgi:hypothetical protein